MLSAFFSTLTSAAGWTILRLVHFFHPGILPHSLDASDPLRKNALNYEKEVEEAAGK